jgi:hypothetical protein
LGLGLRGHIKHPKGWIALLFSPGGHNGKSQRDIRNERKTKLSFFFRNLALLVFLAPLGAKNATFSTPLCVISLMAGWQLRRAAVFTKIEAINQLFAKKMPFGANQSSLPLHIILG